MNPIQIPTTPDELKAVGREWNAAQYFVNACEDKEEIKRADDRLIECERAIDACPFTFNEDGEVVPNESQQTPLASVAAETP